MMQYKGNLAHIEFDEEADIFHGEVINIHDVITFQGKSVDELKKARHSKNPLKITWNFVPSVVKNQTNLFPGALQYISPLSNIGKSYLLLRKPESE